jgi:radical SAM/Cys-rich protein
MTAAHTVQLTVNGASSFDRLLANSGLAPLRADSIDTVQVNIGLKCNLACRHCHVEASPKRREEMSWETMVLVIKAAKRCGARTIDITGGEPAMNPNFRRFVAAAKDEGFDIIVRTDLTIMLEDGYRDLPEFLAAQRVQVVASLPCYLPKNVDSQRGIRVYERSVEALQQLNEVGYGVHAGLSLVLVYNPLGPALPPDEASLESDYRRELYARFGVVFTRLIAITNMPIGRFLHDLCREGRDEQYMRLLGESFNPETVERLMCRRQIHVSWDGSLHDCDFNYALGMTTDQGLPQHIRDFDLAALAKRRIATGPHCMGCTAGHGSSCAGALA